MLFCLYFSVYGNNGDIYIVQQASDQEVQLPVKRSKGSSGYIEVTWSLHSNTSSHNNIVWPQSGTISFQEGQWNSTIAVSVASNKYPATELIIWVHLDSTIGGAILASDELTTTKLTITSNSASAVIPSSSKWIVTGVVLGLFVLAVLIVGITVAARKRV